MTPAVELAAIAMRLKVIAPEESHRLMVLSAKWRRVELAIDDLVDDDEEPGAVVVAFPRRG